jgi:hypothetical protein
VHTYTIAASISPARPDDTDPNSANNTGSTTFSVECVIPVAVNIRPGNSDNTYNLNTDALPVGILSTRAGEYGLPLDFDATGIDVSSLRFGQRQKVFGNEAGSVEKQGEGQLQDLQEKDERTKDGDDDFRAQFARENTQLTASDPQACVKGTVLTPSGRFKFFGCDSIRVVP